MMKRRGFLSGVAGILGLTPSLPKRKPKPARDLLPVIDLTKGTITVLPHGWTVECRIEKRSPGTQETNH